MQDWKETWSVAALAAYDDKLKLAVLDYEEPMKYELRTVNMDGSTVERIDITSCFAGLPGQSISSMAVDGEGNTYLINKTGLQVIDGKGEQLFAVMDIMPVDIGCGSDGRITVALQDRMKVELRDVDFQGKALRQAYIEPGNRRSGAFLLYGCRSKLSMDVISGKGPDFIDIISTGNENLFISKNLLEDLAPWIEQDEEIGKEKYLENVLNAYKRDGKLYGLITSFNIRGIVGKKSVVGEKDFFTLERDYQEAMMPEYTVEENGNQVESPKFSTFFSALDIDIYALKQEDVDAWTI